MPYVYGQKVTFVEGDTNTEYPAEIVGPILRVEGRRGGKTLKAGRAIIGCKLEKRNAEGVSVQEPVEGVGLIPVETNRGEKAFRECYTLRVDFGDERFADISGVSLKDKNFNQHRKSFFYIPEPKPEPKAAKADEKKG